MKVWVCTVCGWIYDEAKVIPITISHRAFRSRTCRMISSARSAA